jgi:hypothetical protein
VSAYLLAEACGSGGRHARRLRVAAAVTADGDPGPDGTAALEAALTACGSGFELIERLVRHPRAHRPLRAGRGGRAAQRRPAVDAPQHRAGPGEVRRPDEAVDRRELMLADHGLYGH